MKSKKVTVKGEYAGTVILNDAGVIEWHEFNDVILEYFQNGASFNPVEHPEAYFNTLKLLATGIIGVGPEVEGV
jgi:hypothetical protein